MDEKRSNRRNISKILVLVVALIVLGVSGSYAFYTTTIKGTAKTTKATSGVFRVTSNLDSTKAIKNSKINLTNAEDVATKAEKVTFTVTNASDSNIEGNYFITLKEITISKNLFSNYFKWELLNGETSVASGNFGFDSNTINTIRTDTPTEGEADNVTTTIKDIKLNTEAILLPVNTTHNLTFRIWLENDKNQNQIELTNGTFSGRLYLEAIPISQNQNADNN